MPYTRQQPQTKSVTAVRAASQPAPMVQQPGTQQTILPPPVAPPVQPNALGQYSTNTGQPGVSPAVASPLQPQLAQPMAAVSAQKVTQTPGAKNFPNTTKKATGKKATGKKATGKKAGGKKTPGKNTPAKKPPKKTPLEKFLAADPEYRRQRNALRAQRETFTTRNVGQRADVREDFATAVERMSAKRQRDLRNMMWDFASRGIINSGMYLKSNQEYGEDFLNQREDLTTDRQRSLEDLVNKLTDLRQTNTNALGAAKTAATRRYTTRFGLRS